MSHAPASPPGPNERARVRRATAGWWLVGIAVLGGALRFHALDAQSLWNDELSSWQQSHYASLAEVIEKGVRPTPYPPAYQAVLYFVERFVGSSEVALRFPSALAGTLAVVAMFFLGRQLYSAREGLAAAALLAAAYQPVYFSQEARAYSLLLLFSILSAHFWFRLQAALERGNRPGTRALAGYVACAAGATYLHYFGLLLVLAQLAGLLVLYAARPRQLALAAAVAAAVLACFAPWLPYFAEEFRTASDYLPRPDAGAFAAYWRFLFFSPAEPFAWAVAALLAAAALRGAAGARTGSRSLRAGFTSPTFLLLVWLAGPPLAAWLRSRTATPIWSSRNLLISLPPAYLLLARAVTTLLREPRLQGLAVAALVAVMVTGPFAFGGYYRVPRKEQFREAARAVTEREAELGRVPVIAHAWAKERFDYYFERQGATSRVDLLAGTAADLGRVRAWLARERPEHFWFLLGHLPVDVAFLKALDAEHELVLHVPLYGAFARLYRTRNTGPRRR